LNSASIMHKFPSPLSNGNAMGKNPHKPACSTRYREIVSAAQPAARQGLSGVKGEG
jgi:hypothetical protein